MLENFGVKKIFNKQRSIFNNQIPKPRHPKCPMPPSPGGEGSRVRRNWMLDTGFKMRDI
jgi:hypothetical protein